MQFKCVQLISGARKPFINLAGFNLRFRSGGLARLNSHVKIFNHRTLLSNVLARAFQRVIRICKLLIDALKLGIHFLAAFLCPGNVKFSPRVLLIKLRHSLLVELCSILMSLCFRFQLHVLLLDGVDLLIQIAQHTANLLERILFFKNPGGMVLKIDANLVGFFTDAFQVEFDGVKFMPRQTGFHVAQFIHNFLESPRLASLPLE